jgi:hypothetical protein
VHLIDSTAAGRWDGFFEAGDSMMLLRYPCQLLLCFFAVVFSTSVHAVTYTYQTNFFNPLHDITQSGSPPDFFGLKFDIPFTLLANSVYSISVVQRRMLLQIGLHRTPSLGFC